MLKDSNVSNAQLAQELALEKRYTLAVAEEKAEQKKQVASKLDKTVAMDLKKLAKSKHLKSQKKIAEMLLICSELLMLSQSYRAMSAKRSKLVASLGEQIEKIAALRRQDLAVRKSPKLAAPPVP